MLAFIADIGFRFPAVCDAGEPGSRTRSTAAVGADGAGAGRWRGQFWRHAAWPAALLALVLYVVTLSRNYSADSLIYAMAVESGDPARLFDPYHLLLHPLGWLFCRLWCLAGWSGGSLLPLQVLNALGGALSVGLVAAIVRRITGSGRIALLVAAGFAVSGGVWLLSVEAEFVTIPLASQLLVLWLLLGVAPERAAQAGYAALVGLAIALATLTYLTGLLLLPVAVAAFLMERELDRPVRRRQVGIVAGSVALVLVPAFVLVNSWIGGAWQQVGALWAGGEGYGQVRWIDLPLGAYAFLRSLALYPNLAMNTSTRGFLAGASNVQRVVFGGYYAGVAVLAAAPLWLMARRWRHLWQTQRRPLVVLLCWAVLYASFAVYWVPGDISFWAPVLAAWWLLVALVPAVGRSSPVQWNPGSKWLVPAGIAVVILLVVGNGAFVIWPRHDLARNQPYHVAKSLAARTGEDDLIITRADDLRTVYTLYFAERRVLPLQWEARRGADVRKALLRSVAGIMEGGGRVFVVGIEPDQDSVWDSLLSTGDGIEPAVWSGQVPAWQVNGETIWQLLP